MKTEPIFEMIELELNFIQSKDGNEKLKLVDAYLDSLKGLIAFIGPDHLGETISVTIRLAVEAFVETGSKMMKAE